MNRLPTPGADLLAKDWLRPLLDEVLTAAILVQDADSGDVQLYNPATGGLEVVAQRGFELDAVEHFSKCDETTAWGRALVHRTSIVVEDITKDPLFAAHVASALAAGFRAVQSTPMFGRGGQPLGVISTHFRGPHKPSDHQLLLTDLYARLTAELIERQTRDEALRASEARFRALVHKLPAAVYTCDAAGYLSYFNESAAALWGRRPELGYERWCGSLKILLTDGSPVAHEISPMAIALKGERKATGEEVVIERPDGTRRNVMVYPEAIHDAAGSVVGGVNMLLDITDFKAAQAALRSSEDRFRRYFDLGLIGMATTSPTKRIIEVNDELCRILGYERGELLQKTWSELTHPDDLAADVAQFNRAMTGEIDGYTVDKPWIRKDGQLLETIVSAQCLRRADGSVDYFVGLLQDITERKRMEEKLKRSEAYLSEGQRISHTGSWAIRLPSGEMFCSEEVFRIYGLDPEATISLDSSFQLLHPEDRGSVEQAIRRAIREKTDYSIEHRAVRPDGALRYLHALGHPVFNDAGELVEYVGTVADITERRRAEEALKKLQSEVAHGARVTMMGEFAAAIAHEVNQPLGAIVNNASAALRMVEAKIGAPAEELLDVLADIVSDASRASAIIARMRGLMTRVAPVCEPLRMGDVVRDVLAVAERELTQRRIALRLEIAEDLAEVWGDRVQLQQVILNLVVNAADAMDDVPDARRILTIGARNSERGGEKVVLVTMHDLGCGFAAETSERLFDALYTTKADGLGMGLRISRSIAEAHGGALWAEVNEDSGATFVLALPAGRANGRQA